MAAANPIVIDHYRTYQPPPLAAADAADTTVLFGGLHWRAERLIQAALGRAGFRTEVLPSATKADLLTGRELADIGQCCPTSFTTGNLANLLREKSRAMGAAVVEKKYVHLTAGSCGACRFGQYHQSYELALRNIGLEKFRLFMFAQTAEQADGGLDLPPQAMAAMLWGVLVADVLQDLEYQVRPFEVNEGETNRVARASVERLYETFTSAPVRGGRKSGALWYLVTPHFERALRDVYRSYGAIAVDRLRVKPKVKITGEFYLQTTEGEANYNIHRWLESEGAEVYPAPIGVWIDYLLRVAAQDLGDRVGLRKHARAKHMALNAFRFVYRRRYDGLRAALGGIPRELPRQEMLRDLAAPYFHSRLNGGEGDMLVGKALWVHLHKKAHMTCELSPYACMPNTMSVGAMSAALGQHPDVLYAPLEIKGDAEVHALSRCQMILTEAKRRAQSEFDEALERSGLTLDSARARLRAHPAAKAGYKVPAMGAAGTAANLVLHLGAS